MQHTDELGLLIGFPLPGWTTPARPPKTPMLGRTCRVEPLDVEQHAAELFAANQQDHENRIWAYLAYGPFSDLASYRAWMEKTCLGPDPMFHAIVDLVTEKAVGVASYLRIDPPAGSIEVGHINYAPPMQRSIAATEAMYLMMRRVFELGYRRYEWKCDNANARSRRSAERLGFTFEGVFRQCTVYKGRNRDTAWFSILDKEWPAVQQAFETWLDPKNFDAKGQQRQALFDLTKKALTST
ncbi:MAG: GNAT family protein [Proteobacteria bacterium]|nr:GNAT family protein [Pseudomonadota bacterium]